MTAISVLDARNLQVTFPSRHAPVQALNGVDLQIRSGALFVLLGPNGAGKTTLMRCITGLVKATAGSLSVFGSPSHRSNLERMGVLIENPGHYSRMDARAYLSFFGGFYSIEGLQARIDGLCGEFGLILDGKPVAKLSQGNRHKLQLVRSLLHRPDFLLWDEPTDHLDPVSQKQILQYLRRYLSETGATALVATHRLEQMESVASHFGFLVHGKLMRAGIREEILSDEDSAEAFKLGFARGLSRDELNGLAETFKIEIEIKIEIQIKLESSTVVAPGTVVIKGQRLGQRMPLVIREIINRNLPLATVEPIKPTLSDIYERWVGK